MNIRRILNASADANEHAKEQEWANDPCKLEEKTSEVSDAYKASIVTWIKSHLILLIVLIAAISLTTIITITVIMRCRKVKNNNHGNVEETLKPNPLADEIPQEPSHDPKKQPEMLPSKIRYRVNCGYPTTLCHIDGEIKTLPLAAHGHDWYLVDCDQVRIVWCLVSNAEENIINDPSSRSIFVQDDYIEKRCAYFKKENVKNFPSHGFEQSTNLNGDTCFVKIDSEVNYDELQPGDPGYYDSGQENRRNRLRVSVNGKKYVENKQDKLEEMEYLPALPDGYVWALKLSIPNDINSEFMHDVYEYVCLQSSVLTLGIAFNNDSYNSYYLGTDPYFAEKNNDKEIIIDYGYKLDDKNLAQLLRNTPEIFKNSPNSANAQNPDNQSPDKSLVNEFIEPNSQQKIGKNDTVHQNPFSEPFSMSFSTDHKTPFLNDTVHPIPEQKVQEEEENTDQQLNINDKSVDQKVQEEEENTDQQHQIVEEEEEDKLEEEEDIYDELDSIELVGFKPLDRSAYGYLDTSISIYVVEEDRMIFGPFRNLLLDETPEHLTNLQEAANGALDAINARIEIEANTFGQQKKMENAVRVFKQIINFPDGFDIRSSTYYRIYEEQLMKSVDTSKAL